jgi:hypothetical protein
MPAFHLNFRMGNILRPEKHAILRLQRESCVWRKSRKIQKY